MHCLFGMLLLIALAETANLGKESHHGTGTIAASPSASF